jgi:hypothetical protein
MFLGGLFVKNSFKNNQIVCWIEHGHKWIGVGESIAIQNCNPKCIQAVMLQLKNVTCSSRILHGSTHFIENRVNVDSQTN